MDKVKLVKKILLWTAGGIASAIVLLYLYLFITR